MDLTSENIKQATQVPELREEVTRERENYKYIKLTGISNVINSFTNTLN